MASWLSLKFSWHILRAGIRFTQFTPGPPLRKAEKLLTRIINLGQGLTQIQDVNILLEKILSEAHTIARADAGSMYVKKESCLLFIHAQNDALQQLLPQGTPLKYATFSLPLGNHSIAGYVGMTVNIPRRLFHRGDPARFF
jgi:hypothetical protein